MDKLRDLARNPTAALALSVVALCGTLGHTISTLTAPERQRVSVERIERLESLVRDQLDDNKAAADQARKSVEAVDKLLGRLDGILNSESEDH